MNWTATASGVAALAAAAGVYFTGQSLNTTREQNAAAEQSQFTDRYTKAVDQLDRFGADHLQARLGALYALERLAKDSPRDQPAIIEVLSAFVRTTSPRDTITLRPDEACLKRKVIAPDVQAALTILGRRDTSHDQGTRVHLQYTCLAQANLRNANLAEADLAGAVLYQATLSRTSLDHADLFATDLRRTFARGMHAANAYLWLANLQEADLADADLNGANLAQTNLRNASLAGANLTDADLGDANLIYSNLIGANLTHANLARAKLTDAIR